MGMMKIMPKQNGINLPHSKEKVKLESKTLEFSYTVELFKLKYEWVADLHTSHF